VAAEFVADVVGEDTIITALKCVPRTSYLMMQNPPTLLLPYESVLDGVTIVPKTA